MQTFLPVPDFAGSARVLDRRRLGKQRVEALQVLRALVVPGYGWRHHPAAKMWTGYPEALTRYGLDVCAAWCATGAADTCAVKLVEEYAHGEARTQAGLAAAGELPPWLGDDAVRRSHRSALVRKDPAHYGPLKGPCHAGVSAAFAGSRSVPERKDSHVPGQPDRTAEVPRRRRLPGRGGPISCARPSGTTPVRTC